MSYFPPPTGSPSGFDSPPFGVLTSDDAPPPAAPKPSSRRAGGWRGVVAGGVAGAILGGGVAFATVKVTEQDGAVPAAAVAEQNVVVPPIVSGGAEFDIQEVLAKVSPSVVSIETGRAGQGGLYGAGAGSGVVISEEGLILTNNHVIESADAIKVSVDGNEYEADLIGSEPTRDIALVRVRGKVQLSPATLGDTATLRVGDTVVAIGNALNLGETPTVTVGIVSAKGRTVETETDTLRDLIQTDAAINPGNSGGALVNTAGELVGINTAGVRGAQNISFAIDINGVKAIIEDLKQGKGEVTAQPFLGVGTVAVDELAAADREQLGVTADRGVVVTDVQAGSGAEAAGIEIGDVILTIDGKGIDATGDVRSAIVAHQPNDTITVVVERDGQETTLTATLGSRVPPSDG